MVDTDNDLVTSAENEELGTSAENEENEDLDLEDDDQETDDQEVEEKPQPKKDYKQKFNSLMSNFKKLEQENKMLKSSREGNNVSKDDLAALKEKYEEEDLEVIQKIIDKKLQAHEDSKLEQREMNIFLKDFPEVTESQLKHLKFMQKEFGYSLKYAYQITFGKGEKPAPKNHSVSGGEGGQNSTPSKKKGEVSDDDAYKDMKMNFARD